MFRFERTEIENPDPPVYRKTLPPALRNTLILSMSPMVEGGSMDESDESSYDDSTLGGTKDNGCIRADACGIFSPVYDALSGLQEKLGSYCN